MVVIPPGQRTEYAGHDVSIEVLAAEVGDNPMVERPPFDDVTTTHEDDALVVAVGGKDQAGAPA